MATKNLKTKEIDVTFEPKTAFIERFPFITTIYSPKKEPEKETIVSQLRLLFSEEKAILVKTIREGNPVSIYGLAKLLKRDFKSVRQDLMVLEQFGVIKLVPGSSKVKKGVGKRKVMKPVVAIEKLVINLEI